MRAIYTGILCAALGLASLIGGCGSSKVDLKRAGIDTGQHSLSYDAQRWLAIYVENRRQHREFQCEKQEISAILMAAAAKDGDLANMIELDDLKPFIKEELQRMEAVYGGKFPGMKDTASNLH